MRLGVAHGLSVEALDDVAADEPRGRGRLRPGDARLISAPPPGAVSNAVNAMKDLTATGHRDASSAARPHRRRQHAARAQD
jgi:hypothetical protein